MKNKSIEEDMTLRTVSLNTHIELLLSIGSYKAHVLTTPINKYLVSSN